MNLVAERVQNRPDQLRERADGRTKNRLVSGLANPYVIALVAFLARLVFIYVRQTYIPYYWGNGNAGFGFETGSIARSVASGEGFSSPFLDSPTGPTAWIGPIYPYLCAAVFKVFGIYTMQSHIAILGLNSVFSAFTAVVLYRIANRLFDRTVALCTAWTWALCPYLMIWPAAWVWEISLSALLMSSLVLLALRVVEAPTLRRWVQSGSLYGLAALTNPAILAVLPVMGTWTVVRLWKTKRLSVKHVFVSALVFWVVITPWLVRNRVVLGRWEFIRDNFPLEFRIGNYVGASGMGWAQFHPVNNAKLMREYREKGELGFLDARRSYPGEFIREHTREFINITGKRIRAFWDGESLNYSRSKHDFWQKWTFTTFSGLALMGYLLAIGNRVHASWLMLLVTLLYPVPYYITYAQTRYRHAVEPIMTLAICYFLVEFVRRANFRWQSLRNRAC